MLSIQFTQERYLTGSLEKAGCETCGNPDVFCTVLYCNVLYCFITDFILMHGLSTLRF